jgi:hypothetical protein
MRLRKPTGFLPNFKKRDKCGVCNKSYQVWMLHPEMGLIRGIQKLPNGIKRCLGCDLIAENTYIEQKATG